METVYILSCCKTKKNYRCKAWELYCSLDFKKCLAYAKKQKPDGIIILSSKHGVVDLDTILDPYEDYLGNKKGKELDNWIARVLIELTCRYDFNNTKFVILTGSTYYKHLLPYLKYYEIPMKGLTPGFRLHYLNQHI